MYKQRKAIMQRAKLFGVFCAAMLLCVPFFNVASARESRQIIRVGSFPYEGQLMVDVYGNYSGYGFDYLQEISTYTDWQYEFVDAPWQECLSMLERGEIDIMGAVMRSPEREKVYDFSDHPVGSGYGVLATCLDNETLPYNDLNAIKNLKIGVLKGNLQMNSFLKYCAQYGFTPHLQQYSTQNDLDAALDAGKIEAVVHSSVLRSEKLRVIAKFGENDSYFATTKGNTRLLSQLNNAMMQIRLNNPYFNSDLNEKYYNLQAATPISFNRQELNFIKNSPPVRCTFNSDARPISYVDPATGRVSGIVADICKILEEKTGLAFEFIHTQTLLEAVDAVNGGRAQLMLTKTHDLSWAQKNQMFLTEPYLAGQTMMVTNGKDLQKPVVALYDLIFQNDAVAQMIAGAKDVKHYHTMTDSLDAVRGGEADVTFVNSVIMSYYINIPKYKNLAITPLYGYSADTCIAVSAAADPLLLSILNKGLGNISATQMNSIVAENMKTEHSVDLASVIYDRPVEVVIWVSSILLAFASVLFVMLSNRAKSARIMKTMLYTDSLTGYPNYKALVQDAPSLIGKNPERYALVYMDMRQFKSVNDAFGYDVGDLVIKAISTALHDFIKKDERFARIYADTFVILLRYTTEREFASRIEALSERLTALPAGEFESANFLFSGGVYHLEKNFRNIDHACDRANYAKSSVKEHFSNSFVFYDDLLHAQIITENHLNRSMTSALESNEFIPYYQPKVNVVTGEVIGAEALVRWLHPEQGCLAPGVFLPFYEKNGFVVKIDFAIFEQVCAHLRKWLEMGIRPVPISVNFSRQHMKDKLIAQRLLEIADRYKVPHHLLEIEITETVELESIEPAVEFVKSLKSLGFLVSIDDYGVGYSSISLLQELPLDVLKLDKKFIENAMLIPKARDIMHHMITAMKNNGIRIICEGIETEAQRDFIVSLNCCFAQGFLYARPMPPEEFERYLMNATTAASPNHSDLAPVSNFVQRAWAGSEDFLTRVMPGWILGCYVQDNYPIFYISPGFLEGLGYSEPEFDVAVGRLYVNCLHPDDLPGTLKLVEENTVKGREMYLQYRLRKKDGGYLWIRDISKRILTDEGKEALLCVCTDITDIVSLQQENSLLIDTIPGGVVELLLGENGIPHVQKATDRFYAIIGHTKEEMDALDNELLLVLHEEDRPGLVEKIREASSSGLNAFQHNLRVQHNDGGTHWVALRGTVHVSYRGSLATVICHNIDAEMRERQNAEVVRAKLELALMLTNHAVFEYDVRTKASSGYSGFEDDGFPSRTTGEAPLNFTMGEYIHPEDSLRLEAVLSRIASGEPYASVEVRMLDKKAAGVLPYIWTRITFSTVFDESGRAVKAVGIVEDIDQEKRFEHAFAQEEQYRSALSECALLAYDINLTKDTVTRITGVSQERFVKAFHNLSKPGNYTELISTAGATMLAYADRERYSFEMSKENLLNLYRSGTMEKEFEYRRLMPDGQELWVSAFLHMLCDKSSADVVCFVYYRDIHERKEAEKKLMSQAISDPLTGLMNRSSTERLVRDFLAQDVDSGRVHAFMMMDVDNFKQVNDSYGHQFGDAFLINLAKTLRANIGDGDTASRMGGDEFSVFLKNLPSEDSALAVAQKIKDAVAEIGPSMDTGLKSSVSIGIAVAPIHGADFETLYRCADAAMYTAKREQGAQIAMYGKRMR